MKPEVEKTIYLVLLYSLAISMAAVSYQCKLWVALKSSPMKIVTLNAFRQSRDRCKSIGVSDNKRVSSAWSILEM